MILNWVIVVWAIVVRPASESQSIKAAPVSEAVAVMFISICFAFVRRRKHIRERSIFPLTPHWSAPIMQPYSIGLSVFQTKS